MHPVIETHHLVKRYGKVTAVNGVSLRVARGEIYAFLGLNGAGKTTTMRMLLGMIRPTSGEVWVAGMRIQAGKQHPWDAVGYLIETPTAYAELSTCENLEAVRRLRPGIAPAAVDQVLALTGLMPYAQRRAGTLSRGNAQRLGLAKALMHHPRLLILDEPTNGLDPAGIVEIRALLRKLVHDEGTTVFMSSHMLSEVALLAQRIGIIHQGRLIQELDIAELERNRRRRLLLCARDPDAARVALLRAGFFAAMTADGMIEVQDAAAIERPDDIALCLVHAGHAPTMLTVEQEDLEHYFLRLIGMDKERIP